MTINWYLGTMGFSYKDWSGVFYPEGLVARDYLAYYSQHFNAVELDSTFYGTPKPAYVERWAAVVPPGFTFCAKVPRTITHDLRLVEAHELMEVFVRTMTLLGDKLGAILIQLPPDMPFEHIHHLAVFLRWSFATLHGTPPPPASCYRTTASAGPPPTTNICRSGSM